MNNNPYTLSFGKAPISLIERDKQSNEIINSFLSDNPSYQVCTITGVRGNGKTVALTTISNEIAKNKNWIIVNLNSERDLIESLTGELCNRRDLKRLFIDAKINLSMFGLGVEMKNVSPITDIIVGLRMMLKKLTEKDKKVLITIDEVIPNKSFKEFANQIQIFIRENLNVFLLMSGLYDNIDNLQNVKTLTFLYRSPKIDLKPLDTVLMAKSYEKNLSISFDDALQMAKLTKGYAFAFQLLGYLCWENKCSYKDVLNEFDDYIDEYSYDKIWSECSDVDQLILKNIKDTPTKTKDVLNASNINSSLFSIYRKRLIKKGLIESPSYGTVVLTLPRFREYVKNFYNN